MEVLASESETGEGTDGRQIKSVRILHSLEPLLLKVVLARIQPTSVTVTVTCLLLPRPARVTGNYCAGKLASGSGGKYLLLSS